MFDPGFLLKHTPLNLVVLAALLLQAIRWERTLRHRAWAANPWDGLRRFVQSTGVIVTLGVGGVIGMAMNLYIAYESPRDIVQEIASVELLLQHRPAYQIPLTPEVDTLFEHAPAHGSLGDRFPALANLESRELLDTETSHWVDAHPPAAVLLTLPFVVAFGIRGASLGFSLFNLACGVASLLMILGELAPRLSTRGRIGIACATACWLPSLSVLRNGQIGLVTLVLFVGALVALRRERPTAAGICVGLATALRLYPGFLFGYLLLRSRRALAAAAITVGVCFAIVMLVFGPAMIGEYLATGRFVLGRYATNPGNLSLLAALDSLRRDAGLLARFSLESAMVLLAAGVGLVFLLGSMRSTPSSALTPELRDLEFATFVPGVVLFAPVAWEHHLVILLLPLFVLGRTLIRHVPSWPASLAFLALLAGLVGPTNPATMVPATVALAVWSYGLYLVLRDQTAPVTAAGSPTDRSPVGSRRRSDERVTAGY